MITSTDGLDQENRHQSTSSKTTHVQVNQVSNGFGSKEINHSLGMENQNQLHSPIMLYDVGDNILSHPNSTPADRELFTKQNQKLKAVSQTDRSNLRTPNLLTPKCGKVLPIGVTVTRIMKKK